MFGAIAAGALGALASTAASYLTGERNASIARETSERNLENSKDFAAWQAKALPSMQVEGLRSAGINPLLAYGNIGSSSSQLVHDSPTTVDYSNLGKGVSELPERTSALKTAEAQRELLRAQAHESESRARNDSLRTLVNLEMLNPSIARSDAQRDYYRSLIPKGEGNAEFSVGLPFGLFNMRMSRPLGHFMSTSGFKTTNSAASQRSFVDDIRSHRVPSGGLDDLWMPIEVQPSVPRKAGPYKSNVKSGYKRPGSLGH